MADEVEQLIEQVEQLFKDKKYSEIIDLLPDEVLSKYNVAVLYAWKGRAYYSHGNIDLAEEYANKALNIDAKCSVAYLAKGNVWSKKENLTKHLRIIVMQ
jgi:tetratricopeptide (TPR) repeat protein